MCGRTTVRHLPGAAGRLIKAMLLPSFISASLVLPTLKQRFGSGGLLTRVILSHSFGLGLPTPRAWAFRRMTLKPRFGSGVPREMLILIYSLTFLVFGSGLRLLMAMLALSSSLGLLMLGAWVFSQTTLKL